MASHFRSNLAASIQSAPAPDSTHRRTPSIATDRVADRLSERIHFDRWLAESLDRILDTAFEWCQIYELIRFSRSQCRTAAIVNHEIDVAAFRKHDADVGPL